MDSTSDSNRFRRLGRAVNAFIANRDAPPADREKVLAQNDEVRDLLEPLLRGGEEHDGPGDPAERAAATGFLGGFRLLREIGRGGMGVVYEAEEFALGRRVALKVLPNQPTLTARQIERFRREAAAAARLKHPGIVPVFSVGEVDGTHYFAMEYIEGKSLGQAVADVKERSGDHARLACIPGAPSHEAEVAEIMAQAAEAVAAAHAGGVLHRDLKPHNILVDTTGRVRVVDFGLAKDLERGSVSRSGEVAGTPHYMSPEQALGGRGVDARTDVFALGIVLYELLTLRLPFEADTPHQVLQAILTQVPEAPRKVNPRVSRDLETICLKAIERDAHYRYRTAAELAAELRRFLRLEPIAARPPGSVTRLIKLVRRRKAAALAALLGFLVVVVGPLAFAMYQRSVRATLEAQETATAHERDKARTNFARARRLLEQQLERVEQLGREPGMETVHRQMADDALAYYQEFLGQRHASPEDAELELRALETHVLVARIHLTRGDHGRALAVLGPAMTHIERLRSEGVTGARWANVCCDILRHRASARRQAGALAEATADLQAAVAQQEQVLAGDLDPVAAHSARMALAKTLFDLASNALQDGGGTDLAAKHLERALTLATTSGAPPRPGDEGVRRDILRKQGELLRRTGRYEEAERVLHAALEQARAASAGATDDPDLRSAVGTVMTEHGNVLVHLRRKDEAEAEYRAAIALREQLVRDFPRTQRHRHGLETALSNLALLLHGQQRNEDARALVERSMAVNEELLAESPESTVYVERFGVIANLACLIESALHPKDPEVVNPAFERATARLEAMVVEYPELVRVRSELGASLHNHARSLMGQRRWQDARCLLARAIEAGRKAHAADPHMTLYRDFLYNHCQLASHIELTLGDPAAAAIATREASALLPERADVQVAMAQRLARSAALARKGGDAAAARGYEDEALALLARALALDPSQAQRIGTEAELAAVRARPEFRALLGADK